MNKLLLLACLVLFLPGCTDERKEVSQALAGMYMCQGKVEEGVQVDINGDDFKLIVSPGEEPDKISIRIFDADNRVYLETGDLTCTDDGTGYVFRENVPVTLRGVGEEMPTYVRGAIRPGRNIEALFYIIEKELEISFYQ